jgi:hypothetical protein
MSPSGPVNRASITAPLWPADSRPSRIVEGSSSWMPSSVVNAIRLPSGDQGAPRTNADTRTHGVAFVGSAVAATRSWVPLSRGPTSTTCAPSGDTEIGMPSISVIPRSGWRGSKSVPVAGSSGTPRLTLPSGHT